MPPVASEGARTPSTPASGPSPSTGTPESPPSPPLQLTATATTSRTTRTRPRTRPGAPVSHAGRREDRERVGRCSVLPTHPPPFGRGQLAAVPCGDPTDLRELVGV